MRFSPIRFAVVLVSMLTCHAPAFADWTPASANLEGANVRALATCGTTLIAGTYNQGLFLSNDNGAHWTAVNSTIPKNKSIYALSANSTVAYASTDSVVYQSTDKGVTWRAITNTNASAPATSFSLDGNSMYAGTDIYGVMRYSSTSRAWMQYSGFPYAHVAALWASGTTIVTACADSIIYTTNNGAKWISGAYTGYCYTLGHVHGMLFAGTDLGVLTSIDNGMTWGASNTGLPMGAVVYGFAESGTLIIAATSHGIYRSVNGGAVWAAANSGLGRATPTCLAVIDPCAFAGSSSGVAVSASSGSSWNSANTGLGSMGTNDVVEFGTDMYLQAYDGVYYSNSDGANWQQVNEGLKARQVYRLTTIGNAIFAATDSGIVRTTNSGANWMAKNNGFQVVSSVNAFAVSGSTLYAGTDSGVYKTTNLGENWISTSDTGGIRYVTHLCVIGQSLLASTNNYRFFVSQNGGRTWDNVDTGELGIIIKIYSIAKIGSIVWAHTWDGLYYTTNGGTQWIWDSVTPGSSTTSFSGNDQRLFVGTDAGVFSSTDTGNSWTAWNAGLGQLEVLSLRMTSDHLYAATSGGLWRRPLADLTTKVAGSRVPPVDITLLQNYPNPFSQGTTIPFNTTNSGHVTITILDLLGNEVANILDGNLPSGEHKVGFEAAGAPNGVYFYRIKSQGSSVIRQLVVRRD